MGPNEYETVALAIIDQIEAAMMAGEPDAEDRARQLIVSLMEEPNGTMFVLQGVKAMLIWMQKGEDDG